MTRNLLLRTALIVVAFTASFARGDDEGWIELFNGRDLSGWRAVENPESFRVEGGEIVGVGERSHLFYVGEVAGADFRDFVWECEVLLKPGANSGMYFHTEVQEEGWPAKGYEVQLNNTQGDSRKTGGLYAVADVEGQSPAADDEWFTQTVTVRGKTIEIRVNGEVTTSYTEPANPEREAGKERRLLSSGTFALQVHDPGSEARFRRIRVKLLD